MADCIDRQVECPSCSSKTISLETNEITKARQFSCWKCGDTWDPPKDEEDPAYSKMRTFLKMEQKYC